MEEIKNQMEKTFESICNLKDEWDKLDNHERATVEQVAEETGLDELGELKEILNKLQQFKEQLRKVEVIDGYQVYIDSRKYLHIVVSSREIEIKSIRDIYSLVNKPISVPKETMLKIVDFYINQVKEN